MCDRCGRGRNEFASRVQNHHVVSAFTCTIQITLYVYVCDGCGRVRNEFAGRVQKHHVRFRMAILIVLEIVKAAAGLDTLRCRLREGCHALCVLDQNETRFFTYVAQRAESKAATVATSD